MPKLHQALKDDIVRILDPQYHGLGITTGDNYEDHHRPLLTECARELEDHPFRLFPDCGDKNE